MMEMVAGDGMAVQLHDAASATLGLDQEWVVLLFQLTPNWCDENVLVAHAVLDKSRQCLKFEQMSCYGLERHCINICGTLFTKGVARGWQK